MFSYSNNRIFHDSAIISLIHKIRWRRLSNFQNNDSAYP